MPFGALAPMPLRLGGSPTEGWTAQQHARLCADLCAIKRTMPLAVITCTSTGSGSISVFKGQAGSTTAYRPTVTKEATGTLKLTFASSYADEYGVEHPFKIRAAKAVGSASGSSAECEIGTGFVRIRRYAVGTLADGQQLVVVW
jgi:hypothetical protein